MDPKAKFEINTTAALAEIERAAAEGYDKIAPVALHGFYGKAAVARAFKIARARKVVEIAFVSERGTPIYRPFGMGALLNEAASAVKH